MLIANKFLNSVINELFIILIELAGWQCVTADKTIPTRVRDKVFCFRRKRKVFNKKTISRNYKSFELEKTVFRTGEVAMCMSSLKFCCAVGIGRLALRKFYRDVSKCFESKIISNETRSDNSMDWGTFIRVSKRLSSCPLKNFVALLSCL